MFPVGFLSGSPVSTPIVKNGSYAGFYVGWDGNRKFPLDMAAFAFSVEHYRKVIFFLHNNEKRLQISVLKIVILKILRDKKNQFYNT